MLNLAKDTDRGAAGLFYNPVTLRLYDKGVLGLSNSYIWRCPTSLLVDNYAQNVGHRHLDIGPGTGYYLEDLNTDDITLLDLNSSTLSVATKRIGDSANVTTISQSFFDQIDGEWDSIAVNFVLHCIPGDSKWDRLADLYDHLTPGGRVFGSTIILEDDAPRSARALSGVYNRLGVFGNAEDTDQHLRDALSGYDTSTITRHGQVLTFAASKSS